jgi:hypothetical protein
MVKEDTRSHIDTLKASILQRAQDGLPGLYNSASHCKQLRTDQPRAFTGEVPSWGKVFQNNCAL